MSPEGMIGDPGGLRVESVPLAGVTDGMRVHLGGRSTSASFQVLQATIDGLLDEGFTKLLVDCEKLEFLNSTALGYFINLSDRIEKVRGAVGFVRVPPKVRQVFKLLGLENFFPVFESEREAFAHFAPSTASRPAPAANPATSLRPAPVKVIPAAPPPPPPPPPRFEQAPAPAALPMAHPRWTLVLQTAVERGGSGLLRELCARQKVSADGDPQAAIRRLLGTLKSPEDLLGLFDSATLAGLCSLYQVSHSGGLVAFVQRTSTEFLSGILSAARALPRLEPALLPVDLTKDNLRITLEKTALPKRVKSEAAAKKLVLDRLVKVFGKERVGRKPKKEKAPKVHVAEIVLGGEFAVEVRLARALLKPSGGLLKDVQRLLGQLVAAAKRYGADHVLAVLVGDVPSAQAASLAEVLELVESTGVDLVHLR